MKLAPLPWLVAVGIVAVFVAAVGAWLALQRGPSEANYGTRPGSRSADLPADLKLMWQTAEGASTPEAIAAADRVFATTDLVGLTQEKVVARLGDPRMSSDSRYRFPFYPTRPGTLVYRFDNGAGGSQYNIHFDRKGRVRRVQYLMIE